MRMFLDPMTLGLAARSSVFHTSTVRWSPRLSMASKCRASGESRKPVTFGNCASRSSLGTRMGAAAWGVADEGACAQAGEPAAAAAATAATARQRRDPERKSMYGRIISNSRW